MLITAEVKFTGQDKLNKKLKELAGMKANLKIGFFQNAKYPDGTPVAYVAYLNEMGIHNPRRPFLKRTVRKNLKKWVKGIKSSVKFGGFSRNSVLNAYRKAGIVAVGDVKKTIRSWEPGGNSPKTVAMKRRRGRSGKNTKAINPETVLIDSGLMISSVSYEVEG